MVQILEYNYSISEFNSMQLLIFIRLMLILSLWLMQVYNLLCTWAYPCELVNKLAR